MMHVGDIMITVGVFSTMGGYHPLKFEHRGDVMIHVEVFSTMRYSNNKRFPPRY